MVLPASGKTYQLISANPSFEEKQGKKKAIWDNGTQLRWADINADTRAFYWTFTPSDSKYILQNVGTKRYPGVQTAQNTALPSQEAENTVTLTAIGQGQFNITSTGSSAAMHTMGHNSGAGVENFICIWNAGVNSGSAWYIVEAAAPTVDLAALEAAIATAQKYQGHIGAELCQYNGLTEEELANAIAAAQEKLTSMDQDEIDAATSTLNTEVGKLAINMPNAGEYLRIKGTVNAQYIGSGSADANGRYSRTDDAEEAIVYFDGTTLRNVSTGKYFHAQGSWSWADKDNAQTITFIEGAIGKYVIKCSSSNGEAYLYDGDNCVDRGSNVDPSNPSTDARYISWILESAEANMANMRITDAGWATFYAPFAVDMPAGVKAYTGEMQDGWIRMNELTKGYIPANTGVVVELVEGEPFE